MAGRRPDAGRVSPGSKQVRLFLTEGAQAELWEHASRRRLTMAALAREVMTDWLAAHRGELKGPKGPKGGAR
jgi:hypothetical protein